MSRHITIGWLSVVLLLLLAACGNNNAEAPQSQASQQAESLSPPNPSGESSSFDKPATRTVKHLKGNTEIPAQIDKVVVLSAAYIDHLLTIGEKPFGVNVEVRYGGDYLPYLADQLEGVQTVGSADSPNLEAIVQLEPDVILIESRTAENTYEQLNKIAPTIVLGNEWLDYDSDTTYWTQDLLTIAEMYDKVELAKSKIAELDAKTAEAGAKIKALSGNKLAYLRVREKTLQIYAAKGHPTNTLLYHDLGFTPAALTPSEQREDLSLEKVADLDSGYIVLEVDPNGREFLKGMNDNVLWNKVPAVQQSKVYETDSFWLFKGWGVIGRGEIVDEVLKMIE
jgi:iron complex transport system substrate-binding protein